MTNSVADPLFSEQVPPARLAEAIARWASLVYERETVESVGTAVAASLSGLMGLPVSVAVQRFGDLAVVGRAGPAEMGPSLVLDSHLADLAGDPQAPRRWTLTPPEGGGDLCDQDDVYAAGELYEAADLYDVEAQRLVVGDEPVGVMGCLYRRGQGGDGFRALLECLAPPAAVAMANALAAERALMVRGQLQEAVRSRERIGLARGILMQRQGLNEEAAMKVLVQASQRSNRKVRALAEDIIRAGGNRPSRT